MNAWDGSAPDATFAGVAAVLARLAAGDAAARAELLRLTADRLYRLATAQLRGSFPRLAGRHDPASVAHDAYLRLHAALAGAVVPAAPADFFRFAAHKIRLVLLDYAAALDRAPAQFAADDSTGRANDDPSVATFDPARLAVWTEFHRQAGELPADERAVFDLHYYAGLTQKEAAALLGRPEKAVSRLWLAATQRLADRLPDPGGRRD